jgi:hypothetical protein
MVPLSGIAVNSTNSRHNARENIKPLHLIMSNYLFYYVKNIKPISLACSVQSVKAQSSLHVPTALALETEF